MYGDHTIYPEAFHSVCIQLNNSTYIMKKSNEPILFLLCSIGFVFDGNGHFLFKAPFSLLCLLLLLQYIQDA